MQVKLKKVAAPYIITYTEDAEVVDKLIEEHFNKHRNEYEVKGFRKGSAPRKVVEKSMNKFLMYREVFDELYLKAIEQENLKIIDASEFIVLGQFEDGQPLTIQAKIYLQPEVKFTLDNLKVKKEVTEINDEKIEEQIKLIQNSSARYENITKED